jgi:hypothetical protein
MDETIGKIHEFPLFRPFRYSRQTRIIVMKARHQNDSLYFIDMPSIYHSDHTRIQPASQAVTLCDKTENLHSHPSPGQAIPVSGSRSALTAQSSISKTIYKAASESSMTHFLQ